MQGKRDTVGGIAPTVNDVLLTAVYGHVTKIVQPFSFHGLLRFILEQVSFTAAFRDSLPEIVCLRVRKTMSHVTFITDPRCC